MSDRRIIHRGAPFGFQITTNGAFTANCGVQKWVAKTTRPEQFHTRMQQDSPGRRRHRPPRKPSAFENTIDDLTMKRLGRGSIYYGERQVLDEENDSSVDEFLKPNPVLVTGGTGRTGQWIALGLMNQGFNVRCFTRNFDNAEAIFGPSGSNLDIFQGDIGSIRDVYDAVEGSQAIVCASGAPWWRIGGHSQVDLGGVSNLVAATKRADSVKKFVLISCADDRNKRGSTKRAAEKVVMESGIPYVIFRAVALNDEEGGLKKIVMSANDSARIDTGTLSRVDLAQCVCQALVYDRSISQLNQENPSIEFEFPSCVIHVENGEEPTVVDKRFWKKEFNRISQTQRDREDPQRAEAY